MGTELPTEGPFARLGKASTASPALHNSKSNLQEHGEPAARSTTDDTAPAVETNALSFSYPGIDGRPLPGVPPVVEDMSVQIPQGSRVLLIGPNGAGKTTLLKILGGKHMVKKDSVKVLGRLPFHDTPLTSNGDLSYLGGNWERDIAFAGYSIPLQICADLLNFRMELFQSIGEVSQEELLDLQGDFPVSKMVNGLQGVDPKRKAKLLEVLDIDLEWRMHLVSDGQRRRVQLLMGLLQPFKVLLLDEITVDLDVLGRADLLEYLKQETEQRKASIIYATHIFDGLELWPTHIMYLASGQLKIFEPASSFPELQNGRLLSLVEGWLRKEIQGKKRVTAQSLDEVESSETSKPQIAEWSNGYASGRMTSTMKDSSNAVMRM